MVYHETKDAKLLDVTVNTTNFYLKNLPEDLVPLWDFSIGKVEYTPEGKSYAVYRTTSGANAYFNAQCG